MCSYINRKKKALGEVNSQGPWTEMLDMGPEISDAEIQYHSAPTM